MGCIGTRVGKYQLGRTIGEGTFAKVKLAVDGETGQCVAIKVIDKKMVLQHKLMYQVQMSLHHAYYIYFPAFYLKND